MGNATVRAGIDASALQDHASTNYGKASVLYVAGTPTQEWGYLYFKSPVPAGATVLSATLRVHGQGNWGVGTFAAIVDRVTQSWAESTLTWNKKPAVTSTERASITQTNPSDGFEWAFDVTAMVQAWANGAANYGVRLARNGAGARHTFYSLNSTKFQPTLDVTWSDAPDAPHTLSPSGGRATSLAKPWLRFDYHDVSGSVALAAVQVQIDPDGEFVTTVAWDSGTVAATEPQLDLSTTSYPGLADGATTYWRCRVQDGAGLWSDWSAPAQFSRAVQGTLALVNPADVPNNMVSDSTPPIIWTLTGRTQTAYRIAIANALNPTKYLWDSGKIGATDTTITVPANVITDHSATYVVTLQVWDDQSREATPNDPTYTQVVRSFTFGIGNGGPVTSLAVALHAPGWPWFDLTWQRSSAPDYFYLVRDGKVVAGPLDPGDLNTGGTSYAFTDVSAPGNVEHTWSVLAVVNGVGSGPNPTVSAEAYVPAVWLSDPVDGHVAALVQSDQAQASFSMPEHAGVYEPLGGSAIVRVTQAQRGLEGTITGATRDYAGRTAAEWENDLLWFKANPNAEAWLTFADLSLRVIVGNVLVAPVPSTLAGDHMANFDFWSLDGPPQPS